MTSQATDTLEAVSEGTDRTGAVITYVAPEAKNTEADVLDRAGNALLGLVNRAARTAEAASVRYYQDRTEHAEKWLNQISSTIQQKFLSGDDSETVRAEWQSDYKIKTRPER